MNCNFISSLNQIVRHSGAHISQPYEPNILWHINELKCINKPQKKVMKRKHKREKKRKTQHFLINYIERKHKATVSIVWTETKSIYQRKGKNRKPKKVTISFITYPIKKKRKKKGKDLDYVILIPEMIEIQQPQGKLTRLTALPLSLNAITQLGTKQLEPTVSQQPNTIN